MFRHTSIFSYLCALTLAWTDSSMAYEIDGTKWIGGKATFYIDVQGVSISNISWNSAIRNALEAWSEQTVFDFSIVEEYADPCGFDLVSSIDFKEDICGTEFGENVLAIAQNTFQLQELGPPAIVESDIIVKSSIEFDIYSGPITNTNVGERTADFGRVILHELGHSIGLGHESELPAVMAPTLSDIDQLQDDDINGVNKLYTGLSNCSVKSLAFGSIKGALDADDCTVEELTVGGTDNSFIDLYEFQVADGSARLEFNVTSNELDSVLILATKELEYLAVDTFSSSDCDSSILRSLGVGSYLLMVNTYDKPIKSQCGGTGRYTLTSNFLSSYEPLLSGSKALLGAPSEAKFTGGVSGDGGNSFGNVFEPDDTLEISARILIDADHQGLPGFILVAAILSDQFLMLNEEGEFVDTGFNPSPFVVHKRKLLDADERIEIATGLVPAELGIEEIEVNIVVGYGVDSNLAEVYYHQTPINLIVRNPMSANQ
jgi:predicted Zn-dependent protease